jgi:hypothetical protein
VNWDHRPVCVLITGKKGSGKTTYWLNRVSGHRAKWKFVFDPCREVSRKLRVPVCIDAPGLNRAVARGGLICFDSSPLFPGDRRRGFAFFCRYVFNVAKVLKGVKTLNCDEFQSVQRTGDAGLPPGLKEITDEGRREEIDCLFAAQRLNEINDDVRGQLTEVVSFRHNDALALRWLAELGFDPREIAALPAPGGFITWTDDGRITHGTRRPSPPPHAPGAADRYAASKIRAVQDHRGPLPDRDQDGRFSRRQSS